MKMTLKQARERRHGLMEKANSLMAEAREQDGVVPGEVLEEVNGYFSEVETLDKEINFLSGPHYSDGPPGGSSGSAQFVNAETRQPIRAYDQGESVVSVDPASHGGEAPPRVGRVMADLITGNLTAETMAAGFSGSDSSGGYLLNPMMSAMFIDLARSASVAMRAGARTIPMTGAELVVVRLTQDPTAHWRREGTAVTASSAQFGRIVLRPKSLAVKQVLTIELVEDASNIVDIIESAIRSAMGLKLDQAVLLGSGAEAEPKGVVNTEGVNTETGVGTPADYSDVTSSVRQVFEANYPGEPSGLAWIMHPRDAATYDGLVEATEGQPLRPTPWAGELRQLMTTSMPTDLGGGAESQMIVGDFSEVVVGMRTTGVRVELLREGAITDDEGETHNLASEMKVAIRAYLRADVAVMRPAFFTVLSGVTAT